MSVCPYFFAVILDFLISYFVQSVFCSGFHFCFWLKEYHQWDGREDTLEENFKKKDRFYIKICDVNMRIYQQSSKCACFWTLSPNGVVLWSHIHGSRRDWINRCVLFLSFSGNAVIFMRFFPEVRFHWLVCAPLAWQ